MSKKNKAKFVRQIKNQVLNQIAQTSNKAETVGNTKLEPSESIKKNLAANIAKPVVEIQNLKQIKADLAKTGIVVAVLAVAILVLAILDQKHHVLLTFGNFLFKLLHIQ